jgi:hypothetical protein
MGGHLSLVSFAEYTGPLILASKGEVTFLEVVK